MKTLKTEEINGKAFVDISDARRRILAVDERHRFFLVRYRAAHPALLATAIVHWSTHREKLQLAATSPKYNT